MKRSTCASGKRIGALLLDRILRRQDQERIGQMVGVVAERHLAFLHRFEQRALHLGRRAIDFIGQNEIGENRAVLCAGSCRRAGCKSCVPTMSAGSMSGVN